MKTLRLPEAPRALVFDLDNTLYTNPAYAAFQEDVLVARLGRELGLGIDEARATIGRLREERVRQGRGKTSLGNLFTALGFDIATSVRWREECIEPGAWLGPNPRLDAVLGRLAESFSLALVTNNPRSVGEKSLVALGVRSRFIAVIGLDDTMRSKPAPEPFSRAAELLYSPPAECISIGDRYDVDLAPALELGMGAILVDGVEDVYELPRALGETLQGT